MSPSEAAPVACERADGVAPAQLGAAGHRSPALDLESLPLSPAERKVRAITLIAESCTNAIVGVPALGEGWHNNHQAFPTSARHGLTWWQFDPSSMAIKALELVGSASNVTVPTRERMEGKLRA